MNIFNNIKTGTKLLGGFLLIGLIITGLSIFNYLQLQNLGAQQDKGSTISKVALLAKDAINDSPVLYQVIANAELNLNFQQTQKDWDAAKKKTEQDLSDLAKAATTDEQKNQVKAASDNYARVVDLFENKMLPALQAAKASTPETLKMDTDMDVLMNAIDTPLEQITAVLVAENTQNDIDFDASKTGIMNTGLIIAVVAIIIAILLGIFISGSITGPLSKGVYMIGELNKGHLSQRLNMNRKDEIGILANVMDQFADNLQNIVIGTMKKIATGDLSSNLTAKDNQDEITPALNSTVESLRGLVAEARRLSQAAVDGKLSTRGDTDKFQGGYKEIVQGVNNTLDAVIDPLNVAAGYVDLISRGEIPEKIVDNYNGDFNTIKNNINSMLVYLEEMAQAASQIAEGDLTAEVSSRSKKDVLGIAFSQMIGNLNNTMAQTNAVTNQVVQAVQQVRSVSQDLSSNAQEQAAAVEEVASSVQETDSQVKASADHASLANQLASQTTTLANNGQAKMNALGESINSISHSSHEISKIIKVIDDIAFQTNLLALNAAVEAARAGQYGKGFAVVAQEVRNLAERSAKAAKSTAELIEDSSRRVAEGVSMTGETAQSLNEIVQNVVKVKDLVGEIAAASDEQTKALNQISQAINQVSQGTQSNSSQSEELASTADELGGLADRLREEVDRFKLRQVKDEQWNGLPAGLTPEMLQAALSAVQKNGSKKASGKTNLKVKPEGLKSVDRDERGYGNF
jgi:methyl-accepting chemotaxis protein